MYNSLSIFISVGLSAHLYSSINKTLNEMIKKNTCSHILLKIMDYSFMLYIGSIYMCYNKVLIDFIKKLK